MRYSNEFKRMCVEMYWEGRYPPTPRGLSDQAFHHMIREWVRRVDAQGFSSIENTNSHKRWTPEEKLNLVQQVILGNSCKAVAFNAGISHAMLYTWVRKYKEFGYNGLVHKQKGRKSNNPTMKKNSIEPKPLTVSEREELIRLRAENETMRAEIEVVKKKDRLEARKMGCATQGEKAAIIKELREEGYQLKHLLNGLKMSRSTYYYEISKVDAVGLRNAELMEEIKKIFNQHKGRYGVRRVHRELLNRGYDVNHKRVQRIMHSIGLCGKRPKEKYHSFKGEVGKVAPNIIDRDFTATAPFQKWTTDVSQFNFTWGKCYLSPILDMYTNEVISYDLSMSPNLNQITRMLNRAFKRFESLEGLIFHSDQGWQYQHQYFRQELKNRGIVQSMSRRGNCIDNCINKMDAAC